MKTAVLFRLGGLGDILILTPVAKELKRRGYEVDAVVGSPTGDVKKILGETGLFRNIILYSRFPQNGVDICEVGDGDWMSIELIKDRYDLVVDYKYSIELNSHWRHMADGPGKEWFVSQNSNYMNWVDVMFAWAGIDPNTIAPEDKIPIYATTEAEKAWADRLLRYSKPDVLVAIQTTASSLVRTWYNPQVLPEKIMQAYEGKRVEFVIFDGSKWHHLKNKHDFPVVFPKDMDPLRASAALVGSCDIFIGADSGFSHVAEALGVKSITIYTTVPAWTRMKYYKHAEAIEPIGDTFNGVQCRPCFVLDRYCPRVREKVAEQLSPREKELKEAMEKNIHPAIVAQSLKTTPNGVMMEANVLRGRLEALLEMQAPCSMTITPERIVEKMRGMI